MPKAGVADRVSRRERLAANQAKELYWRDHARCSGPASGIAIADELRRQVIAQRPDWPSGAERAEDHAAHLRVLDALSRVATRTG
ncbi:MAG: hypothetical protein IT375_11820 [Polyangiaceae bacterium]|nr:hypothetical protein [Polyangiaceae bacterium]